MPTPTLTTLITFNGSNGTGPYGSLITDATGDLFGTTWYGGSGGSGNVFEIKNVGGVFASTPTELVGFNSFNGAYPYGSLLADANGNLFGTVSTGGTDGAGAVFEIANTAGVFASTPTILAWFNNANGSGPMASLIADGAGNLYGTTSGGGAYDDGEVFEIAKSGGGFASTPTVLFSFNGTNGDTPYGSLWADANGDLFGTTTQGGANIDGEVFELQRIGGVLASTPTVLVSFNYVNGALPKGGLVADAAGNLFGTASSDGASGSGVLFEIQKTGGVYASTPTVLLNFNSTNGAYPQGDVLIDAYGDVFGTTANGGAAGGGTVFELKATGGGGFDSTGTVLASFQGTNGANPFGGLRVDANGNLFGTTQYTGLSNAGDGTVFEITNSGYVLASTPMITSVTLDRARYKLGDTVTATVVTTAYDGSGAYTLGAGSSIDGMTLTGWSYNTATSTGTAHFVVTGATTELLSATATVNVTVVNGSGTSSPVYFAPITGVTIDANVPTAIALTSTTTILSAGYTVGRLSTTDATPADIYSFALVTDATTPANSADNSNFVLSGNTLLVGGTALTAGTDHIEVQVTDLGGNTFTQAFTITAVGAPTVLSIVRGGGAPAMATASSEAFTVTFSRDVTGVTAAAFTATTTGSVADSSITVSGSGSVYTVTVNGVTGSGKLGLSLSTVSGISAVDDGSLMTSPFTGGQTYTMNYIPPSPTVQALMFFNNANGYNPGGGPYIDANGDIFGVTMAGGSYTTGTGWAYAGVIFEIKNTGGVLASTEVVRFFWTPFRFV